MVPEMNGPPPATSGRKATKVAGSAGSAAIAASPFGNPQVSESLALAIGQLAGQLPAPNFRPAGSPKNSASGEPEKDSPTSDAAKGGVKIANESEEDRVFEELVESYGKKNLKGFGIEDAKDLRPILKKLGDDKKIDIDELYEKLSAQHEKSSIKTT